MNYYIQGNKERAKEIKAAFEKLGYNSRGLDFSCGFFYTVERDVHYFVSYDCVVNIIKTHPDYKELGLPKPNYDISNFKPFDKVLVRCNNDEEWMIEFYCKYDTLVHTSPHRDYPFIGIGDSYSQCIPFEGNEHLLGTMDTPSEEYINW